VRVLEQTIGKYNWSAITTPHYFNPYISFGPAISSLAPFAAALTWLAAA